MHCIGAIHGFNGIFDRPPLPALLAAAALRRRWAPVPLRRAAVSLRSALRPPRASAPVRSHRPARPPPRASAAVRLLRRPPRPRPAAAAPRCSLLRRAPPAAPDARTAAAAPATEEGAAAAAAVAGATAAPGRVVHRAGTAPAPVAVWGGVALDGGCQTRRHPHRCRGGRSGAGATTARRRGAGAVDVWPAQRRWRGGCIAPRPILFYYKVSPPAPAPSLRSPA